MKNLVILYGAELSLHAFEKVFGSKSAFERVVDWASLFSEKIILLLKNSSSVLSHVSESAALNSKIEIISKESWTKSLFISEIAEQLKKNECENALVSYADTPFLNEKLTRELLEMHSKYAAEYSFADGFPYGLTPEVIESGTSSILAELSKNTLSSEGEKPVDREALFSVMKGDINSFEIETLIADEDYRLLRFSFEASSKINFTACKNLFEKAQTKNVRIEDPYELSNLALKSASVMATVPAFYNIQISSKFNHKICYTLEQAGKNPCSKDFMSLSDFKNILCQIKDFSENAVISLSAFGEPLLNPEFSEIAEEVLSQNDENHKISLLIETDGIFVTEALAEKIADSASKNHAEVNWIVYIDAVENSMYASIHNCEKTDFEKALSSVVILEKKFENHVYPQFMRMKTNESQLEAFYRFWKEKESPSKGQLVIQKYNSMCGALPDLKSADLSPVNRLVCWHLRRDMTILCDGEVPLCFQLSFNEKAGNILTEGIEKVWTKITGVLESHISKNYSDNCSICDESYTFNF
ncbi:spiro-SPASM protein [Treponema sp.]|uniref:spiro-SPASM protein n=1 Tax=Treponema sp. TaxID=166 RepID=UPI00388FD168